MQVFTELSANQKESLDKPCRKCGNMTVRQRWGRYGPWVMCDHCGEKVYRPRGRSWTSGNQPMPTPQATGSDGLDIEPIPAKPVEVSQEMLDNAIVKHVMPHVTDALKPVAKAIAETESLRGLVLDELAKLEANAPKLLKVVLPDGSSKTIDGAHFQMPRLLRLMGAGLHVYLWGDAGTGKTTAAQQAAAALGRESEIDTLDPTTFRSMVQGYMTPKGEPVHTTFTRCWVEGKVYVADETDNAPGHVQTLFNSALANGHAPLAWGNVARSKTFSFVGTGNTPGRPTRAFPDRKPMSAAFMDRLYHMYWPLDLAIECRAVGLPIPATPPVSQGSCSAKDWVRFVQRLRDWAKANAPTLQVTPRASLLGVTALQLGETPAQVADGLIFRGADEELKSKCLNAVPLPK